MVIMTRFSYQFSGCLWFGTGSDRRASGFQSRSQILYHKRQLIRTDLYKYRKRKKPSMDNQNRRHIVPVSCNQPCKVLPLNLLKRNKIIK